MARFHFKALNGKGETVEGEIEASDKSIVVEQLRQRQQMPLAIEPAGTVLSAKSGSGLIDLLNQPIGQRRGLKQSDVAVMTRELATLLNAGLTVDQSLSFLIDVAATDPQRRLLADLLEKVQGGSTLADALQGHGKVFSNAYVSMVRAGEAGNALNDVLSRLSQFLDESEQLSQQVKSALVYPIMLLIMAGASVVVLLTLVVPQFTPMFETAGAELPFLTQIVVGLGDAAQRYWWLALLIVAALFLWIRMQFRDQQSRARLDRLALKLPLIGDLIAKIDTARLARTVGTLHANGVDLPRALLIGKETMGNAVLRDTLAVTHTAVKEGKDIAGPLARSGVFPKLATHLIAVGEKSGQLEEMLLKVATIFDQEVKTTVERLMTLLVPTLTIGVGLVIATIIGAILSAILAAYQLPL
ncbi:MAG: type II secretion system F family protein [Geminicoccaceae bacterium]